MFPSLGGCFLSSHYVSVHYVFTVTTFLQSLRFYSHYVLHKKLCYWAIVYHISLSMPTCSHCNYSAPTNARFLRHLDTMKHARNVMLAEVGLLDTIRESTSQSDILSLEGEAKQVEAPQVEAPQVEAPKPSGLSLINPSSEQCMSAVVESPPSVPSNDASNDDMLKGLDDKFIFYSTIDQSALELFAASNNIGSIISRFFSDHPLLTRVVQIIGFIGLFFINKPRPSEPHLVDSC